MPASYVRATVTGPPSVVTIVDRADAPLGEAPELFLTIDMVGKPSTDSGFGLVLDTVCGGVSIEDFSPQLKKLTVQLRLG